MEELIEYFIELIEAVGFAIWENRIPFALILLVICQCSIIRQYREMNKTLHDIVYQMIVDRNKDRRIDKIDDKAEWRK